MLYKDFKSTGENLYHPHPCVRCGIPNDQKGRMAKVMQVVGCPNSTDEAIERLWREVERKLLSSQLWHVRIENMDAKTIPVEEAEYRFKIR